MGRASRKANGARSAERDRRRSPLAREIDRTRQPLGRREANARPKEGRGSLVGRGSSQ